jgi:hypothetical protein
LYWLSVLQVYLLYVSGYNFITLYCHMRYWYSRQQFRESIFRRLHSSNVAIFPTNYILVPTITFTKLKKTELTRQVVPHNGDSASTLMQIVAQYIRRLNVGPITVSANPCMRLSKCKCATTIGLPAANNIKRYTITECVRLPDRVRRIIVLGQA